MPAQSISDDQQGALSEKIDFRRVLAENAIIIFVLILLASDMRTAGQINQHKFSPRKNAYTMVKTKDRVQRRSTPVLLKPQAC